MKPDFLTSVREVLQSEANAIFNLQERIGPEVNDAINLILKCESKIIVTGMGKSGLIAKKIAATMASTGTPAIFLHPAEGVHGDLGIVTSKDIVLAISKSGETTEVLNLLPSIKRIGAKIIVIVGPKDSTLAKRADVAISLGLLQEACPFDLAPTTSTTVTLALGDAIAIAILKERNFKPEHFALFHPGGSLGRKLLLTVEDVIETFGKNPCVLMNAEVKEALFKMTEDRLGATNIIDESGNLVGILTDGDVRRALSNDKDFLQKSAGEFCTKTPVTVVPNILAVEALKIMEDKKINVLSVLNDCGKPIGMINIQNLLEMGLK